MAKIMVVDDAPADLQNLKNILPRAAIRSRSDSGRFHREGQAENRTRSDGRRHARRERFPGHAQISKDPDTSSILIIGQCKKSETDPAVGAMRQGQRNTW
jgi:hypothetical protein